MVISKKKAKFSEEKPNELRRETSKRSDNSEGDKEMCLAATVRQMVLGVIPYKLSERRLCINSSNTMPYLDMKT